MRANFDASLAAVLKHEAGYVNNPHDKGGPTNRGVTKKVYDLWRADHGLPIQSVRLITPAEVFAIYRKQYWERIRGDELPAGVDYCVFDFSVNSGPVMAARFLQGALLVDIDGKIGPMTLAAARAELAAPLIDCICDLRQHWLEGLDDFQHFGKGWSRRVAEVRERAKGMACV